MLHSFHVLEMEDYLLKVKVNGQEKEHVFSSISQVQTWIEKFKKGHVIDDFEIYRRVWKKLYLGNQPLVKVEKVLEEKVDASINW